MKKRVTKLTLSRETVRNLEQELFKTVAGGYSLYNGPGDDANFSCNPVALVCQNVDSQPC